VNSIIDAAVRQTCLLRYVLHAMEF